jgi:hypothetical protein
VGSGVGEDVMTMDGAGVSGSISIINGALVGDVEGLGNIVGALLGEEVSGQGPQYPKVSANCT